MVLGLTPAGTVNFFWFVAIFSGGAIAFTVWWMRKKAFPFEVIIHNDQRGSNTSPIVDKDRARLIKLGDHGEQVYWLRKNKCARIGYGKYVGHRKIAWVIEDGLWFNILYGRVDKKLKELGIEPLDRNSRLAAESIVTLMDSQFRKKGIDKIQAVLLVGAIIGLMIMGYATYKNLTVQRQISSDNAETIRVQSELYSRQIQAMTNFTEGMKDVIGQLYRVPIGSGLVSG